VQAARHVRGGLSRQERQETQVTVASHLACDVGVSNTASETSSDATAKRWNRRERLGFSWRSWRPLRDAAERHLVSRPGST
jgi:hypothetical protein